MVRRLGHCQCAGQGEESLSKPGAAHPRDRTRLDARFPPGEDDPTFDQLKVNSEIMPGELCGKCVKDKGSIHFIVTSIFEFGCHSQLQITNHLEELASSAGFFGSFFG